MIHTHPGLAPPHPELAARLLSSRLLDVARAIHDDAGSLVGLTRIQAAARVRRIVASSLDLAAIGRSGIQLERSTGKRFADGLAAMLSTRRRGDRAKRTTISASVGRGGAIRIGLPDAGDTVDAWATRAAKLVRGATDDVAAGIAADVVRAVADGTSSAELAARWRAEGLPLAGGGRLESRLALIADNQLARLQGELGRVRAKAAGLGTFRWIDQGDARVRPLHRQLGAGGPYSYDDPPAEGLPGTPPNCRCHAQTVVTDDDLDRLLGLIG